MTTPFLEELSKEKLVHDLRSVVSGAEDLLRATANQTGDKISDARDRIEASLADARVRLADAERSLRDTTRQAATATDEYVRDNPWQAVGIAAGVGMLIGMLISRGR